MRYMNKRREKKQSKIVPFNSQVLSPNFFPYMLSLFEEGKDAAELANIMAEKIMDDNRELAQEMVEVFLFESLVEAMENHYLEDDEYE